MSTTNPYHMPKYHMPSGELADFSMTEIESKYLSPRKKCRDYSIIVAILLTGVIVISILHFVVEPHLIPKANAATIVVTVNGENTTLANLCAQYTRDGHSLQGDLKTMCHHD